MRRYSWQTTTTGVAGLALTLLSGTIKLLHGESLTEAECLAYLGAIVTCIGLIVARDNNKTSWEVGADQFAAERTRQERTLEQRKIEAESTPEIPIDHEDEIRSLNDSARARTRPPVPDPNDNFNAPQ